MCFPERLVDIAKAAHDVVETKPDHLHRCDRVAPLVVAERSVEVLVAASETLHVVVERPCQLASGGDLRRQVRRLDVTRRSRAVVSTVAIAVSRSSVVIPTIMAATKNNFRYHVIGGVTRLTQPTPHRAAGPGDDQILVEADV